MKKPGTKSATTRATASHIVWDADSFLVAMSRTGPSMIATGGTTSGASIAPVVGVSGPTTTGTTMVESRGASTAVVLAPRTDVAPTPTTSVTPSACTGLPSVNKTRSE